jgi:hypothetical protein
VGHVALPLDADEPQAALAPLPRGGCDGRGLTRCTRSHCSALFSLTICTVRAAGEPGQGLCARGRVSAPCSRGSAEVPSRRSWATPLLSTASDPSTVGRGRQPACTRAGPGLWALLHMASCACSSMLCMVGGVHLQAFAAHAAYTWTRVRETGPGGVRSGRRAARAPREIISARREHSDAKADRGRVGGRGRVARFRVEYECA